MKVPQFIRTPESCLSKILPAFLLHSIFIFPYFYYMTNPYANSIKLLTAINLLAAPQGATIKSLMENLNISRRSVFRLIQALQELNFPIIDEQSQRKTGKVYRLMDSYIMKLPNITILNPAFTGEEIELILAILDLCRKINELGGTPRLNSIKGKISAIKSNIKQEQST